MYLPPCQFFWMIVSELSNALFGFPSLHLCLTWSFFSLLTDVGSSYSWHFFLPAILLRRCHFLMRPHSPWVSREDMFPKRHCSSFSCLRNHHWLILSLISLSSLCVSHCLHGIGASHSCLLSDLTKYPCSLSSSFLHLPYLSGVCSLQPCAFLPHIIQSSPSRAY